MGAIRHTGTVRFVDERLARRLKPWAESTRDEKTESILALQARGYTAAAIGGELQTSRNAVLGHIHRHRDCFPDTASARRRPKKVAGPAAEARTRQRASVHVPNSQPRTAVPKTSESSLPRSTEADRQPPSPPAPVVAPAPGPMDPSVAIEGGGILFSELADGFCRFPLWPHAARPAVPDMRFCGQGVHREGSSWCCEHLRKIRVPL